jgi:GDPmannose 4,6-dehydratase
VRNSGEIDVRVREGDVIVRVDPQLFRPAEVDALVGDATRAHRELGWQPRIHFDELVREMMQADLSHERRGMKSCD